MKPPISRASRWLSGLPTIFVVVLWFVLWRAWPTVSSHSAPRRSVSSLRVTYQGSAALASESTLMPLAFVQTPAVQDSLVEEDVPDSLRLLRPGPVSHGLDRKSWPPETAGGDVPALLATAAPTNAAYRPSFDAPRVFAASPPRERTLVVDMSGSLRERDFAVPAWTAAELEWTNAVWQVALRVECGEDGAVENVFVESGTTNVAFNLALARRIEASGKALPGARCCGVVTVSYGGECGPRADGDGANHD